MTVRASLFSFFESRIVRVTNLEFSRNDRNSKILSRTILSAGGNGPRVPRKGKLGRGMRYADIPTSRLFPPPLSYPAIPRLERLVAFDDRSFRRGTSGARVEGIGELDPAETWTPTRLEEKEKEKRRRVAWKIYRRVTPAAHPPPLLGSLPGVFLHRRICISV